MTEFDGRMAVLKDKFLERCRSDAAILAAHSQQNPDDLMAIIHRLSGSAGIFGFADLSNTAERAEDALRDGLDADAAIARLIAELKTLQAD